MLAETGELPSRMRHAPCLEVSWQSPRNEGDHHDDGALTIKGELRALLKMDLCIGYVVSDWSPTSIITNKRVLKRQAWRKSGFSLDTNLIFR